MAVINHTECILDTDKIQEWAVSFDAVSKILPNPAKVPPPPPVEDDTEISEECPDTSRNLSRVSEDEMEDSSSSASGFVEEDGNAEATPELESKKKNVIPPGAQIPR